MKNNPKSIYTVGSTLSFFKSSSHILFNHLHSKH